MPQEREPYLIRRLPHLRSLLSFEWSRMRAAMVKTAASNTMAEPRRTTIMNILPNTSEGWSTLFQILTIALVAGTVVTGFLALYFSNKANSEQAERVAGLEKATAEAKQKQTEAELSLEELRQRQEPRRLNFDVFVNTLRDKPKGKVLILYQPNDLEAYSLAIELFGALHAAAKWEVVDIPQPAPQAARGTPPILTPGVIIEARDTMQAVRPYPEADTPLRALNDALFNSLGRVNVSLDESLPDNFFRVLVGPKP